MSKVIQSVFSSVGGGEERKWKKEEEKEKGRNIKNKDRLGRREEKERERGENERTDGREGAMQDQEEADRSNTPTTTSSFSRGKKELPKCLRVMWQIIGGGRRR